MQQRSPVGNRQLIALTTLPCCIHCVQLPSGTHSVSLFLSINKARFECVESIDLYLEWFKTPKIPKDWLIPWQEETWKQKLV